MDCASTAAQTLGLGGWLGTSVAVWTGAGVAVASGGAVNVAVDSELVAIGEADGAADGEANGSALGPTPWPTHDASNAGAKSRSRERADPIGWSFACARTKSKCQLALKTA